MSQSILHCQSHLYPCRLSSLSFKNSKEQKVSFYSPIDTYFSSFSVRSGQNDLIDLDGKRFNKVEKLYLPGMQKLLFSQKSIGTSFSNSNQIRVYSRSCKEILSIQQSDNKNIVSNIVSLKSISQQSSEGSFSIVYLTSESQMNSSKKVLQIRGYGKGQKSASSLGLINPQDPEKQPKFEEMQEQTNQQDQNYLPTSFKSISLPFSHSQQNLQQSYQISSTHFNSSENELIIFDKNQSLLYQFDIEYQAFTSIIPCSHNDQPTLGFENKISLLSENLILKSDINGIITIFDKRMGRVAHVRDLMEEVGYAGQHFSCQENFIKFWDQSAQQTNNYSHQPTTKFMINLSNQIYGVDLRNNHLDRNNSVFKFRQPKIITDYEISIQKNTKIVALTTETHSSFKGYVVKESLD